MVHQSLASGSCPVGDQLERVPPSQLPLNWLILRAWHKDRNVATIPPDPLSLSHESDTDSTSVKQNLSRRCSVPRSQTQTPGAVFYLLLRDFTCLVNRRIHHGETPLRRSQVRNSRWRTGAGTGHKTQLGVDHQRPVFVVTMTMEPIH